MVSHADRRLLYTALHDQLGERPAAVLMEMLPDVMPSELARQSDLVAMSGEIAELRGEVRTEMGDLRTELKTEMADLRTELKTEMADLRTELKTEISGLRVDLTSRIDAQVPRFILASVPMALATGGLVLAAAKLA